MRCACLSLPLLLGVLTAGADDKKPADKPDPPKLPLGRDTTYFVGPLDKQGYIDYEAALNAELGRGVTPETNANALLWMAFGPTPEGSEMPPAFYKWLDITPPPKDGGYFLGLGKFAREKLILSQEQMEAIYEFQSRASNRPWAAKDCPPLAAWLEADEKPIALAQRAVKLPHYYNPLASRREEGQSSNLIGALLPSVQKCRELASAFACRAMLRVHEGKFDDAWQDLLACHRLGRHVSRGATLIEGLVGIAVCQIASNATVTYVEHAKLSSAQAAERLKDLRSLPPLGAAADRVALGERTMGLDALQNIRRGGGKLGAEFGLDVAPSEEDLKALEKIDWTPAMKTMNTGYDRMVAAMRLQDRTAREKEFDKIDEELRKTTEKYGKGGELARLAAGKDPGKEIGEAVGGVLMGLLSPAVRKVQGAHDRAEQVERNLHVAFALAAYHADNGRYPPRLGDLAPKYLAAVPGDLFSGKALLYKPAEKGYLFYSVGQNGKDDEGRWYDDTPPGDDPRVRMPQPPPKKN